MDFPATRTPRLPPATRNDSSAQRETGNRDITCGHDSFQVTGDGHSGQPFGCQPFSPRPQEPGTRCRYPSSRLLNSRCPCPSPATRKCMPPANFRSPYAAPSEFCLSPYSILHTRYSRIHLCTASLWSSSPPALVSSHAPPLPTGPLVNRSTSEPCSVPPSR